MEYEVKHDRQNHRFELVKHGQLAYVEYEIQDGIMDIAHTLVPKVIEGQGVGSVLMNEALEYARENHYSVVPSCAFALLYLKRHPEYRSLLH